MLYSNLNFRQATPQALLSVYLLHGHTLLVVLPTIIYLAVHCAGIQSMSQHVAAETCPHPELTLDIQTPTACSRYGNPLYLGRECRLAT